MKWDKRTLDNLGYSEFHYSEDLDYSNETFASNLNLLSLKDVHVEGNAKYDSYQERLMLDLLITGTMICPCARTLEPVEYHFSTNESTIYSFSKSDDEDVILVSGNVIDTDEFVHQCIILEIPLRVFKEGSKPIEETKEENEIDPRLAKLKEYFNK